MGDIIEFPIRPPAEGWEYLESSIRSGLEQAETPTYKTELALSHAKEAWNEARKLMTGATISQPPVTLTPGDPEKLQVEFQEAIQGAVDATAEHLQHQTLIIIAALCARIAGAYASD